MLMAEAIPAGKRVTLGGDKAYDTQELVGELRGMNITPHVAQNNTEIPFEHAESIENIQSTPSQLSDNSITQEIITEGWKS
jgi:hypothetical protein